MTMACPRQVPEDDEPPALLALYASHVLCPPSFPQIPHSATMSKRIFRCAAATEIRLCEISPTPITELLSARLGSQRYRP
jgi:hypothetical protein